MALKDTLTMIREVAEANGIRVPYIVGGVPRDIIMGLLDHVNDLDLTNGDANISDLADLIGKHLGMQPTVLSDGHKKLRVGDVSIDFSTHQIYDGIDNLLNRRGITTINGMVRETFSRDFTINTLLIPLDFSKILDITAMGKHDISHKVIRCPVDASIAIAESPNRIIRAFYYAAKYKMSLDGELKAAIKNGIALLDRVKPKYASDKLTAAMKFDINIIDDLIELGVLHKIRLTRDMTEQLISARRLADVI